MNYEPKVSQLGIRQCAKDVHRLRCIGDARRDVALDSDLDRSEAPSFAGSIRSEQRLAGVATASRRSECLRLNSTKI